MTQVIVDEALLREPNLWVPGKKPIGNVKIDWGHSLAKGLIHCILPVVRNGLPELLDIADKTFTLVCQDSAYTFLDLTPDDRDSLVLNGLYSGSTSSTSSYKATGQKVAGLTSGSIHARINGPATGSSTIFGAAGTVAQLHGLRLQARISPQTMGLAAASGAFTATDVRYTYTYTGWRSVCGIWYGGNTQKMLSEGVSLSVSSVVDADVVSSVYDASNTTAVLSNGTYANGIKVSHIFVYGRALSDEEAAALDSDPYQFLIPA